MRYFNNARTHVFCINLKCGHTTFRKLESLNKIKKIRGNIRLVDKKHIILVRNPYSRLESFYKDKIITNLNENFTQDCQKQLLKYFDKTKLLNREITLEDFICGALNNGYTDLHVTPQINIIKKYKIKKYKVLKLEHKQEVNNVFKMLKYKNNIQENKTYKHNFRWTPEMINIVNKKYHDDFVKFQYKKMNASY